MANQYHQLPVDVSAHLIDSQPVTNGHWSRKGVAVIGGSCLALLAIVAVSTSTSMLPSTSAADLSNLIGMPRSLRSPFGGAMKPPPTKATLSAELIKSSPWAKYAITAVEATQLDSQARDISMRAMMSNMDDKTKSVVVKAETAAAIKAQDMPGAMAPIGFFDPFGFTTDASEVFVPQSIPAAAFWPAVFAAIAIPEIAHFKTFEWAYAFPENKDTSRVPGDLGFDPLGQKPKKPADFRSVQEKEINNGRLAMVAAAGMLAQEWATGIKIF